ncbi:hypothetical protein PVK06_008679 [Gossypium arboreum]|uniref:Uncharacterized protein n=1 Tax=Gossypium arboreum TaxID=29729 RepID=A0ABR0QKJ7_GOSAR|nr:hypothetical protein PVK06_008679 [Gossypium arboreum]
MDSISALGMSWRDRILGRGTFGSGYDEDFEFLDGDVMRSTINGVHVVNFSERVHQILVRDMATTVVMNKLSSRKFDLMVVYIDFEKPLVSQILVSGVVKRVDVDSLPLVCFSCGRFGHLQNLFLGVG